MTEDLSHSEIQELLGAYALGAVDERERATIEAHAETCETCRIELADHIRLAAALRQHAARVSPLASAEASGTATPAGKVTRGRVARRWAVPVATAFVIVVVLLGGLFVQERIGSDDVEATLDRIELLERAQLAAADPAAVVTTLRTPSDEPVLTVVSRAGAGPGYAINSAIPDLEGGRTYQLWRVDNQGVTAVATLGRRPETVEFALPAGTTGFLLTVENGPTPTRPTLPAVASARTSP